MKYIKLFEGRKPKLKKGDYVLIDLIDCDDEDLNEYLKYNLGEFDRILPVDEDDDDPDADKCFLIHFPDDLKEYNYSYIYCNYGLIVSKEEIANFSKDPSKLLSKEAYSEWIMRKTAKKYNL